MSGRPFDKLPDLTRQVGPHMNSNICDVYRLLSYTTA